MEQKPDYYRLLGLDRSASTDQIRSAFRNLALKFHPDRKPDAESQRMFRQISEAYDVLSDPEDRKIYDQIGSDPMRGQTIREYDSSDYPSLFRDVVERWNRANPDYWGGDPPSWGVSAVAGTGGHGTNLRVEIEISVADATFGIQKSVPVVREEVCPTCRGAQAKRGSWLATCPKCDGKGQIYGSAKLFAQLIRCPDCKGSGKRVVIACDGCRGAGTVQIRRIMEVSVPARVADGYQIVMKGEGDQSYWNGPPGDLLIQVRIRKGGRA